MAVKKNIRLLNRHDAAIFRSIRLEAVQDSPLAFAESVAEANDKSLIDFENYLDSHGRGDFVLGDFDGEKLIGVIGFFRSAHRKHFHKGTIWGMYVTPAYRSRGVGAALFKTRSLTGLRQINLTVTSGNAAAKRLYEKAGFRVFGIEPAGLNLEGGYFDEELMQLLL